MVELSITGLGIEVIVGIDSVLNGKVVAIGAGVGMTDSLVTSPTGVDVESKDNEEVGGDTVAKLMGRGGVISGS